MIDALGNSRKLLTYLNGLLVLVVLLLLLAATQRMLSDPVQIVALKNLQYHNVRPLRWQWFSQQPVKQASDHGVLAMAKINARLLGVIVAGEHSTATIKFNGRSEQVYALGDKLDSGIVIEGIEHYRVVVRQGGVLKAIEMGREKAISQQPQSGSTRTLSKDSLDLRSKRARPSAGAVEQQQGFVMADMFGALPVSVDGGTGLKLNNLSDELQILTSIQENDVVISVQSDGQSYSINQLLADPTLWTSLSTETNVPVTVLRDGKRVVLNINAASLSARILPKLGGLPK